MAGFKRESDREKPEHNFVSSKIDLSDLHENEISESRNSPQNVRFNCLKPFGGIVLTLLAALLSSTNLILVKILQKSGMGAPEATFWGYTGVFLPSIPLLIYFHFSKGTKWRSIKKGVSVTDSVWPFSEPMRRVNAVGLVVQAFFGGGSILFRFFALKFISVGDTAVISIGSPVIVTILAHFTLNERTGIVPILMALLALFGVFIMTRPPIFTGQESFDTHTLIGTGFAACSLACTALQTIIWRRIRGVQYSVQLLVSGAIGMAVPLTVALVLNGGTFRLPSNVEESLLVGTVATFGFGVTLFMMLALKLETAGVVSLVRTSDALFGFLLQFLLFALIPDLFSALGAVIICVGVLVTGFRKYLQSLPVNGEKSWRNHFHFLLH